jgi:hypothetical protein
VSKDQYAMPLFRLKKDIPLAKAGTIFYYDVGDSVRGSPAAGCLKMAWTKDGGCQNQLCADTIVFHASATESEEWFERICSGNSNHYILSGVAYNGEELYRLVSGTKKASR